MSTSAVAADPQQNPFTLVYQGAITRNEPGKVHIHPVHYDLNGLKIAANVYTPAHYDAGKKYAAIVVAHPNGGVKEQTAGLHAQRLAELGYVTIAMDAAYQGAVVASRAARTSRSSASKTSMAQRTSSPATPVSMRRAWACWASAAVAATHWPQPRPTVASRPWPP